MDVERLRPVFRRLSDGVRRVVSEKNREESDQVCQLFFDLTDIHVHFELLRLDWKFRLDRAQYMGDEFPQNFLRVEYLNEMLNKLLALHRQALELLTQI